MSTLENRSTQFDKDFELKKDGLYARSGGDLQKIGDRIEVCGLAKEENGKEFLAVLRFRDVDHRRVRLILRRSELRKPESLVAKLEDNGYTMPETEEDQKLLLAYLKQAKPKRRYLLVPRTGWVSARFVLEDRVIGAGIPEIIFDPVLRRRSSLPVVGGKLEDWREQVAGAARHSHRMTFALAVALAAPLIKFVGVESGGFHIWGRSSRGKTLLLIASQSVHGWSERKDLLHWDATDTGLEELAAEHCDRVLVLDEISRIADDEKAVYKKAMRVSFALASGSGKLRSLYFGKKGNFSDWRVLMLSSGEKPVSSYAAAAGRRRLHGDLVRLIDVPAIAGRLGVFDSLPKQGNAEEFAKRIEVACARNFGVAGRAFIEHFISDVERHRKLANIWMERFFKFAGVPGHAWERRFASRFAVAYAAGMLARRFRIVPWTKKWLRVSVVNIYKVARAEVPDFETELRESMRRLQKIPSSIKLSKMYGASRPSVEDIKNADGLVKKDERHGKYVAIKKRAFRRVLGDRASVSDILARLDSAGWLIKSPSRSSYAKPVKVLGFRRKRSYYCLKWGFFARRSIR